MALAGAGGEDDEGISPFQLYGLSPLQRYQLLRVPSSGLSLEAFLRVGRWIVARGGHRYGLPGLQPRFALVPRSTINLHGIGGGGGGGWSKETGFRSLWAGRVRYGT